MLIYTYANMHEYSYLFLFTQMITTDTVLYILLFPNSVIVKRDSAIHIYTYLSYIKNYMNAHVL